MYKGSAISKLSFKRNASVVLSRVVLTIAFTVVVISPFSLESFSKKSEFFVDRKIENR